jgi:GNAT superfamily N-acetyltransferase
MFAKFRKLRAHYRNSGSFTVAKAIARSVLSSICDYQIQEVRGRVIWDHDPAPSVRENDSNITTPCVIIESTGELQPFISEFCLPFRDSINSLQSRIEQGCTLILARRAKQDEACHEVVGYSIMEIGAFSVAGIKGRISKDILFVHHTEVADKYRGQRIAERISRARNDYCRSHGIRKSCTAHRPDNTTSARAFRKFGSRILCYAVRVSLLRGLFVWHTPWKKIERAIAELDGALRTAPGEPVSRRNAQIQ